MRVVGIESNVDSTSVLVLVEDLFPGLATVGRTKNAAFGVWPVGMPQGRNKNNVGVLRINDDSANRPRVVQTRVLPGLAPIERLIYPVAVRDVAADTGFAGAGIHDVRVRRSDGDTADRRD